MLSIYHAHVSRFARARVRRRDSTDAKVRVSRKALNTHHTYIAKFITLDLRGDALVVEGTELVFIRDLDLLLRPGLRVRDVELRRTTRSRRSVPRSPYIHREHRSRPLSVAATTIRPLAVRQTPRKEFISPIAPREPPKIAATAHAVAAFAPRDHRAGFHPRREPRPRARARRVDAASADATRRTRTRSSSSRRSSSLAPSWSHEALRKEVEPTSAAPSRARAPGRARARDAHLRSRVHRHLEYAFMRRRGFISPALASRWAFRAFNARACTQMSDPALSTAARRSNARRSHSRARRRHGARARARTRARDG